MERNRKAIQAVAAASLAAVGAIISASPTMRAQLGGVRAAFTLFAETIIDDLLPAGTNLGSMAVGLARRFQNLPGPIRKAIGILSAVGAAISVLLPIASLLISSFGTVASALAPVISALGSVLAAAKLVVAVLATIIGVSVSTAAAIIALVAALAVLTVAIITDFRGIRTKAIEFLTQLLVGARDRLLRLLRMARTVATNARDFVANRFQQLKQRVLSILSLAREFAQKGKEWVGGMIDGVRDRVSALVGAFRDMAGEAARAFRNEFNRIIPDSVQIPSVTIGIPDILGGGSTTIGGGSIDIPQLNTGGRIASDGLAMLHAGERIMPAAQVRERGPQPTGDSGTTVEEVTVVVMGSGNAQADGRNVARAFQRELEDRGA